MTCFGATIEKEDSPPNAVISDKEASIQTKRRHPLR